MNTNFHYTPAQFLALLQEARRRTDLPPEVASRLEALCAHIQGRSISDVCRVHGISRQTFYRWLHRFDATNLRSLADHPKFFAKPAASSMSVAQAGATLSDPEPACGEPVESVEGKSNGWKRALLMVSLALNVLLIGIGIGLALGERIKTPAHPASLIEVRVGEGVTTATGATVSLPTPDAWHRTQTPYTRE